jgi:hypothetical protein
MNPFHSTTTSNLAEGHLNLALLAVAPLIVLRLDELMIRQPRRPVGIGIVIGLLIVLQFFIGTEVLATVLATIIAGMLFITFRHARAKERLS